MVQLSGNVRRSPRPALTAAFLVLLVALVSWRVVTGRLELAYFMGLLAGGLALGVLIAVLVRAKRSK